MKNKKSSFGSVERFQPVHNIERCVYGPPSAFGIPEWSISDEAGNVEQTTAETAAPNDSADTLTSKEDE